MFKSRLPIQDEEAGVMRVIMTPIATRQGLPSPGAFLGWAVCPAASSSLGAQGAWQGCQTSRDCCPEMTFLNFQAFCCHWDKFLLKGLWGHIWGQGRGWGLPVPSWGAVGTLPARAPGLPKSQEWGWRQLVTPSLAHVLQQQWLPARDTISFSSVPGPCGSLSVPFGTDSSVPLDKPAAVKGQRKNISDHCAAGWCWDHLALTVLLVTQHAYFPDSLVLIFSMLILFFSKSNTHQSHFQVLSPTFGVLVAWAVFLQTFLLDIFLGRCIPISLLSL